MNSSVPEISAADFWNSSKDSFLLIDVREQEEYEFTHVEGSLLCPLGELEESLCKIVDSKPEEFEKVVVICRSGQRSEMATSFLLSKGISNAHNLAGGLLEYASFDAQIKKY